MLKIIKNFFKSEDTILNGCFFTFLFSVLVLSVVLSLPQFSLDSTVIAAIIAGSFMLFGYVITYYFQLSLLISSKSYTYFKYMVDAFEAIMTERSDSTLKDFKANQSKFINSLRQEVGQEYLDIDFETYDFRL